MNTQNDITDFIFGYHAVEESIKADKPIDKILLRKDAHSPQQNALMSLAKKMEIPFQFVPVEKMNRITRKQHQGVIALLSPVDFFILEGILPELYEKGENPFILVLDSITDVRNFGAICRTADATGVHAIVIPERGSARINADAMKTSAGALSHVKICRTPDLKVTINYLKESGIKIVAASEKSNIRYDQADITVPTAIIMGAEDTGVSEAILRMADELVKIPMLGHVASLNVSVAAGVLMYELVRQRIQNS